MKLAKLSLAAMVVAGLASSSFAADTLADAFKNGSVNGELKAYYFTHDDDSHDKTDIFSTGVMLGYKTAPLYGLTLGLTFQGSASPFADGSVDDMNTGKGNYKGDMYGSGAVLSEAYVAYNIGKTTAMVGRMFLDTPLVASSGSRLVKQAFEGAAIINTDLPDTTLIAGYVQKFQGRTDGEGSIGKFSKAMGTGSGIPEYNLGLVTADGTLLFDDGAFTLAAINKSISGLTLTLAYAQASNIYSVGADDSFDLKIGYAEAAYEGKASNFTYGLAAQYYYNNINGVDVDANDLWGVKASLGYGAYGIYAAYTKVNNKEKGIGVAPGLGGGADLAYTDSPINSTSYFNGEKAYKIGATYAILKNANLGISYTVNDVPASLLTGEDAYKASYAAIEADYAFEGSVKGLSTSIVYEDGGKDVSGTDELWVKVNYKF